MGVRPGEHRTFPCARTVHDKATPAFFYERLAERVPLFLPIVDTAPVHDYRGGKLFRKTKMADDRVSSKRNRHGLDWNVKIFRRGEKHLAGFFVAMVFARGARKGMTCNTVITIGFKERFFGLSGVAGLFCGLGLLFPAGSQ